MINDLLTTIKIKPLGDLIVKYMKTVYNLSTFNKNLFILTKTKDKK